MVTHPTTWRRLAAALVLLLSPLASAAQPAAPAAATEPDPQDVERTISTLEDPEARAELVQQLKVLLQAQHGHGQAKPASAASGGNIVDTVQGVFTGVWDKIVSVEPRQLLISIGLSFVIVVAALLIRWLVVRLLRGLYVRLTRPEGGPAGDVIEVAAHDTEATGETGASVDTRPRLPRAVTRLINLIIAVLAAALIADTWGAGLTALLQTDLGARIAQAALSIGLILVLTVVAWHISGLVVARLLALAGGARDEERTARRLDTLVPLLRSVLQGAIGVFSALLILSQLGIDIAPLLAGAGILGLAVGFGAQTLVKDLLTGVTILLEDGATAGDVVEVAGHSGVVEQMRIRILRLRDLAGAVHLIPYSEVTSIINHTKDYSYYLMEVGVAYREDTDEVCEALNAVSEELRGDAAWHPDILEGLEILGVDKFADSAVVIKARLKTRPGRQWATGREFNRRMKKLFDDRGIEIPFPHTTVYFGEPKHGSAPPARLEIAELPNGAAQALTTSRQRG